MCELSAQCLAAGSAAVTLLAAGLAVRAPLQQHCGACATSPAAGALRPAHRECCAAAAPGGVPAAASAGVRLVCSGPALSLMPRLRPAV